MTIVKKFEWRKFEKDAILPRRGTLNSAGYDFHANETVTIEPGQVAIVKTGVTFEDLPENMFIQLSLRSSISLKMPILMANGVGIIDADYAGNEIGFLLYNRMPNMKVTIDKGLRLGQGVLLPYGVAYSEIPPTDSRTGGYGSTNK